VRGEQAGSVPGVLRYRLVRGVNVHGSGRPMP
jgi:hypothetical protein